MNLEHMKEEMNNQSTLNIKGKPVIVFRTVQIANKKLNFN